MIDAPHRRRGLAYTQVQSRNDFYGHAFVAGAPALLEQTR